MSSLITHIERDQRAQEAARLATMPCPDRMALMNSVTGGPLHEEWVLLVADTGNSQVGPATDLRDPKWAEAGWVEVQAWPNYGAVPTPEGVRAIARAHKAANA